MSNKITVFILLFATFAIAGVASGASDYQNCSDCHDFHVPSVNLANCTSCHSNLPGGTKYHYLGLYSTAYGYFRVGTDPEWFLNPLNNSSIHMVAHPGSSTYNGGGVGWCGNRCHLTADCAACHVAVNASHVSLGSHSLPMLSVGNGTWPPGYKNPASYTKLVTCANSSCHLTLSKTRNVVVKPGSPHANATFPVLVSWGNNFTDSGSLSFSVERLTVVEFNVTADQVIANWFWGNATIKSGNGTVNGSASKRFTVTGTFYVSVYGTNVNGTTNVKTWTITVVDSTPPVQVSGLSNDTPAQTSVNLSWNANVEDDLWGYEVFKDDVHLSYTGNNYYQAAGLSPSTSYQFKVRANDTSNNWGPNSSTLIITTAAPVPTPIVPVLVSWGNNYTDSGSLSFSVERLAVVEFNVSADQVIANWYWGNATVKSGNGTANSNATKQFTVTGTFYVSVYGTNGNGTTNTKTWTINVADLTPPGQVTGLSNDTPAQSSVNLSWTANTEDDLWGYEVFKDDVHLSYTGNNNYPVTGLSPSTSYQFKVRANDTSNNWGPNSSTLIITTAAPVPTPSPTPTPAPTPTPVADVNLNDCARCHSGLPGGLKGHYLGLYSTAYGYYRVGTDPTWFLNPLNNSSLHMVAHPGTSTYNGGGIGWCGNRCHLTADCVACHVNVSHASFGGYSLPLLSVGNGTWPPGYVNPAGYTKLVTCANSSCHLTLSRSRNIVKPNKHVSATDMSSCIASGCHNSSYLHTEHRLKGYNCSSCHSSQNVTVQNAITGHNRSCDACHAIHGDIQTLHNSTTVMSSCISSGCHNSTYLTTEHELKGFSCSSCHSSQNVTVRSAISGHNTSCSACHVVHGDVQTLHNSTTDMSSCITSGCHNSTYLTTEHELKGFNCSSCHSSQDTNVRNAINSHNTTCYSCHTTHGGVSHYTHTNAARGPHISCSDCHGSKLPPLLADGKALETTAVCDPCHSPNGAYDGVNDTAIGARYNWVGVYNSSDDTLKPGKERWCAGCHDNGPSVVGGEVAANKTGDNTTYGYYVTGHGRVGNYSRMSWQDSSANGNPGGNQSCDQCHNTTAGHIVAGANPVGYRLKNGYENDQSNSNCNNCHPPGTSAVANPQFYTSSADYEASAHGGKNCTDCHEVHGTAGAYKAMTTGNKQNLCYQCHSGHAGHALGVSFGKGGKTYSLECASCHNVHLVTGMYNASNPNKSPITLFSNITRIWGDNSSEKMNAYAGSGTYRTPKGDSYSGSQLPDYPTYCLDCHGVSQAEFGAHGGIGWSGDPHGLISANQPNGYGVCPNWFACGLAEGWDNDVCLNESACWPAIPRGRGDELFSRPAYNHEERIAGANFVLSCTDCHVVHEAGIGSKLRSTVNGAPGSVTHNIECNACHYYYSDWHAGMSCGSASCHVSNSLHRIDKNGGSGGTRTFNPDLVADMRFEGNLKDSGSFQMDGRWYSQYAGGGTGSFVAGKVGQAIQIDGNQPVELGTENDRWSTDAGYHGTWVYSEMKYNMTLEAWVYPTGSQAAGENIIFAKNTYTEGGYALLLKSVGGTLRAALLANVNGGEYVFNSSDCNGLRGAYSSVSIPLNEWTHVAATFSTSGPDRDLSDPSVGRIRIYVNGVDVTTSYPSAYQCYAQPGAGEDTMFPYSDMGTKNVSRCYEGTWCASALSIGGVMWGDGYRKGLIGRIDEAKVWNMAKTPDYFATVDAQTPPRIVRVDGAVGRSWILVSFSEGVYANTGQSGALQPADFTLTDLDNGRTITSVAHTPGSSTANLTLSSALDSSNDINVDTLAAVGNSIYDKYNNPAGTGAVAITSQACPVGTTIFQLNEAAGSLYARDEQGVLNGTVNDPAQTFLGDGYYHGDGVDNYIDFENCDTCLQASTAMTLEARIKPSGLGGTDTYIRRIFARDSGGNYQMSVWRNNSLMANFSAPSGTASIALWVNPIDNHGGNSWKPVLTDYNACPIVSDHWYVVRAVWNSSKSIGIPGDIYVDDQGTDGSGVGENWAGFKNCTDSDQSQLSSDRYLYAGDQIKTADGDFVIGANNAHAGGFFNGTIDWIKWQAAADYSGV